VAEANPNHAPQSYFVLPLPVMSSAGGRSFLNRPPQKFEGDRVLASEVRSDFVEIGSCKEEGGDEVAVIVMKIVLVRISLSTILQ
jgi:hypothetical protein